MTVKELQPRSERARELLGDFWLNGEPVILSALQGSVVLLFFWDYTSAESIQCIPYVNEWSRRYASFGLVTVGIHTPRFAFTRDPQEVERAIAAFGVTFPVVLDNGGMIRGHYEAREWPHFVTIDRHSFIKAHFEGTTGVVGVERMIQALLYDLVPSNELPVPVEPLLERDREGLH